MPWTGPSPDCSGTGEGGASCNRTSRTGVPSSRDPSSLSTRIAMHRVPSLRLPRRAIPGLLALAVLLPQGDGLAAQVADDSTPSWQVFDIEELRERRAETGRPWLQFLQVPDLFAGVYEIAAGGTDQQTPHQADEVYYIVAGRGTIVVEGERTEVGAGAVIYVAKNLEHRFVDVEEDLTVLVFFATPG